MNSGIGLGIRLSTADTPDARAPPERQETRERVYNFVYTALTRGIGIGCLTAQKQNKKSNT